MKDWRIKVEEIVDAVDILKERCGICGMNICEWKIAKL